MSPEEQERSEALEVYKVAVQLWTSEAETIWSKFNVFVVANSIILGGVSLVIAAQFNELIVKVLFICLLGVMGILFCVLWALIFERSYSSYRFWIEFARNLEMKFTLNSHIRIATIGKERADDNKPVWLEYLKTYSDGDPKDEKGQPKKFSYWSSQKTLASIRGIVLLFISVYLVLVESMIIVYCLSH